MPRKELDGGKLADDVTRLNLADKETPPQTRPSLMDAVRQFSTFVETRASLRWSNGAIAAALTEAGYAIDAATLRSYRSRLRAEGGATPSADGQPPPPEPQPPAISRSDKPRLPKRNEPPVEPLGQGRVPPASAPLPAPSEPPQSRATSTSRSFRIDRSTVPSDRA